MVVVYLLVGCSGSVQGLQRVLEQARSQATLALDEQQTPASTPAPTLAPPIATPTALPVIPTLDVQGVDDAQAQAIFDAAEALTINVYERVSPSVVFITSRVLSMDFFGRTYPSEGTGSGFVIDKEGHIVTNNHVIEGAQTLEVTLLDNTVVEATVVGTDPLNDLAVIKVDVAPEHLYPVDMGFEGQIKVGQTAIAIGNPYGLDWTLTRGVISSLGRSLDIDQNRTVYDVIQTDAPINPGNSGGPLLNSRGQLIGVNTAIRQGADNIAFAVPVSTVKRVVPELIAHGYFGHPWIGVSGYSVFPELARRLELPADHGILIFRVASGSPADQVGMRGAQREVILGNIRLGIGGDLLVAIDDQPIEDSAGFRRILETKTEVGQEVTVSYYRGSELVKTEIVVAATPN
jgi:S1-C subfamily serine protease